MSSERRCDYALPTPIGINRARPVDILFFHSDFKNAIFNFTIKNVVHTYLQISLNVYIHKDNEKITKIIGGNRSF